MEKPAFLFDGWNFLDHAALAKIGFNVYRVGAARGGNEEVRMRSDEVLLHSSFAVLTSRQILGTRAVSAVMSS